MAAGHPHDDTSAARRPFHTSTHTALYGPDGLIEAELPLDREPYECLVKAVPAWTGPEALAERNYEQISLQLTGHACAVAPDVHRLSAQLPKDNVLGLSPPSSCARRTGGRP